MVKIAIAGGSGNVGQEIADVLVASKKHEVVILSRKDAPAGTSGVTWVKTDYSDTKQLTQLLQGVHTVLSFIIEQEDVESPSQKRLIDASVNAGVKRFAPSEWAATTFENLPWYSYKNTIRTYLAELNKERKVLEYTLFHPGLFVNYLTRPYPSSKHLHQVEFPIDLYNRRAILAEGVEDAKVALITVQDFAAVVARAIEYEGEWPVISGVQGDLLTLREVIAIGEKARGGAPFTLYKFPKADLEAGTWEPSWVPKIDHPSIPPEQVEPMSKLVSAGLSLGLLEGAFRASDEWNRILADFRFVKAGEFLEEAWRGKD